MRHAALDAGFVSSEDRADADGLLRYLEKGHARFIDFPEQILRAHAVHVIAAAAIKADIVEDVRLFEYLEIMKRILAVHTFR